VLAAIPLRFAALIGPSGTPDQVRVRLFSRERAREKGEGMSSRFNMIGIRSSTTLVDFERRGIPESVFL
jgi:hypothetical protein